MNLAVKIPECHLTSLTIARNCISVWNVCLNPNVNIYKRIKVSLLAHLHTRASIQNLSLKHLLLPTMFFLLPTFVNSKDTLQMIATLKKLSILSTALTHTHTHLHLLHNLPRATYSTVKRTPLIHMRISSMSFRSGCQLQ